MEKTFRINGRVVNRIHRRGVEDLRVEAWDKDLIFNDLLGSANTDAQGKFQIDFKESDFRDIFENEYPDLFIRVFKEGVLIKSTEDSVLWNLKNEQTDMTVEVDLESGE